jgi:hypothetical protein
MYEIKKNSVENVASGWDEAIEGFKAAASGEVRIWVVLATLTHISTNVSFVTLKSVEENQSLKGRGSRYAPCLQVLRPEIRPRRQLKNSTRSKGARVDFSPDTFFYTKRRL